MDKKEFGSFGKYGFKFTVIGKQLIITNNFSQSKAILNEKQMESLQEAINFALVGEGVA